MRNEGNRTVGVIRLSRHSGRADDPSTSPDRQRKLIEGDPGLNVTGWAEDLGVSAAKVPPWDRRELGEWLRRPEDWDTLAFWKLDQLENTRRAATKRWGVYRRLTELTGRGDFREFAPGAGVSR